ncbi:MAG: hypothetical protein R3C11_12480 [Planctomycetaceae bacterium]
MITQTNPLDYLYWEFYEQGSRQAVRFGDWKAIAEPMYSDNIELYNIREDIGEEPNLSNSADLVAWDARTLKGGASTLRPLWKIPIKIN